eukprot:scaffold910_cov396-Prasinococcus_capsulatus_cf.AAC.59
MDTPAPGTNRIDDPVTLAAPAKQEMEADNPQEPPLALIKGPTCFGGCTELCCSKPFEVARVVPGTEPSQYKKLNFGDLATITKLKPSRDDHAAAVILSFGFALRELLTDSDVYEVTFADKSITPQQKATVGTPACPLPSAQRRIDCSGWFVGSVALLTRASAKPCLAASGSSDAFGLHVLRTGQ